MRGMQIIVLSLILLPLCRSAIAECKPVETVHLNVPKTFEPIIGGTDDDHPTYSVRATEYTEIAITIPIDLIARTQRWIPHQSPPALSLSRAIDLASVWVARERSDDGTADLSGAYLARYGCVGEDDYWYYGVRFSPFSLGGDRFESNGATVVVLIDGTVLRPEMVN